MYCTVPSIFNLRFRDKGLYLNREKLYLSRHMAEHLAQRKSLVNLLVTRLTARLWQSPEQLPWAGL